MISKITDCSTFLFQRTPMLPKFAFLALLGLFLASHITTAEGRIKQKIFVFLDTIFFACLL